MAEELEDTCCETDEELERDVQSLRELLETENDGEEAGNRLTA